MSPPRFDLAALLPLRGPASRRERGRKIRGATFWWVAHAEGTHALRRESRPVARRDSVRRQGRSSLRDDKRVSERDEAFVTRLNATGSGLLFSTYLGGNGNNGSLDTAYSVALDGHRCADHRRRDERPVVPHDSRRIQDQV